MKLSKYDTRAGDMVTATATGSDVKLTFFAPGTPKVEMVLRAPKNAKIEPGEILRNSYRTARTAAGKAFQFIIAEVAADLTSTASNEACLLICADPTGQVVDRSEYPNIYDAIAAIEGAALKLEYLADGVKIDPKRINGPRVSLQGLPAFDATRPIQSAWICTLFHDGKSFDVLFCEHQDSSEVAAAIYFKGAYLTSTAGADFNACCNGVGNAIDSALNPAPAPRQWPAGQRYAGSFIFNYEQPRPAPTSEAPNFW